MHIREWPADERPREKLLGHGAAALSDAELLAIFLRTGSPGQNVLELAGLGEGLDLHRHAEGRMTVIARLGHAQE